MKQNLVYLLTNISKPEGKRFYIGSKQEASLEEFEGVMTILNREDVPYYSSSTSYEMLQDIRNGDIFEASVLEYVSNRNELIHIENDYIKKFDAVESNEYYNKAYAVVDAHYDGKAIGNKYGETLAELSSRNSSWSKRDGRAKEAGFDNFGEMYLWIQEQKDLGRNGNEVSADLGKERHFAFRTIKDMDLHLAKEQIDKYSNTEVQTQLRRLIYNNCSPVYACEKLGIELAAGRVLIGEYKQRDKSFIASLKKGMSKDEMERRIVQIIYDSNTNTNQGWREAAIELNLSQETVRRYFLRYVKSHMERPE